MMRLSLSVYHLSSEAMLSFSVYHLTNEVIPSLIVYHLPSVLKLFHIQLS